MGGSWKGFKVGSKKSVKLSGKYIISKRFQSLNKKIVTVSQKGLVTAKSAGKTGIAAVIQYKKNLNILSCVGNDLTTLDLSGLTKIEDLSCGGIEIIGMPDIVLLEA